MKEEKILIVEDEAIISLALQEILLNLGYDRVESAYNASTASSLLQENNYHMVLMDVKLGSEMDGIDVINNAKMTTDVPVIYVTGNSDHKTIEKAKGSQPYGFLTKPVNEVDLQIQMEIALYKEKRKRLEVEEEEMAGNLYKGDCTGLTIDLGVDGQLYGVSPHIKKITGKPSYFYKWKKIGNADFDKEFYKLLTFILDKLEFTDQRTFFGSVFSRYIGERMVEIFADSLRANTYQLIFRDITEKLYQNNSVVNPFIDVALASYSRPINSGYKTLPSLVENARVSAELGDSESTLNYLKVNSGGLLLLDIDLPGGCQTVLEYLLDNPANETNVVILLSKENPDIEKLKVLQKEYSLMGYFSKTADDATMMKVINCASRNLNYYDETIEQLLEKLN